MLFDISGIRAGWGKINKGMIKMYNAEVLSKFPVIQHFPFGSMFRWEQDPNAVPPPPTSHATSQPLRNPDDMNQPFSARASSTAPTAAPWASASASGAPNAGPGTAAPWAGARSSKPPIGMVNGVTRTPWANRTPPPPPPSSALNARTRPAATNRDVRPGFSATASVHPSHDEETGKPANP